MSDLKRAWKKTAKSLVLAANDLGEAVVDTVRVGKKKIIDWAQTEDEPIEVQGTEVSAEESPAESADNTAE